MTDEQTYKELKNISERLTAIETTLESHKDLPEKINIGQQRCTREKGILEAKINKGYWWAAGASAVFCSVITLTGFAVTVYKLMGMIK